MEEKLVKRVSTTARIKLGALMSPFGGFGIAHTVQRYNRRAQCSAPRGRRLRREPYGRSAHQRPRSIQIRQPHLRQRRDRRARRRIFYGMMCYENGGTVDDLLVYKVNDEEYFLVIDAANIDKDVEWIEAQRRRLQLRSSGRKPQIRRSGHPRA